MRNYNSYLPHTASKIVKTMTLPCAMCCSHCHMTLRLCQLPCGTVTCHCHVLLSLPHGTECTATAMWQKKVTTPPPIKGEVKKEIFAAIACIGHGSAKGCTALVYFNNSFLKKHFFRTFLYFYLYNYLLCSILTHVVFDFEHFAIYRW